MAQDTIDLGPNSDGKHFGKICEDRYKTNFVTGCVTGFFFSLHGKSRSILSFLYEIEHHIKTSWQMGIPPEEG